jgi:hypothetical protein
MLFSISKRPQFDENNWPVRGQCQPHTEGWILRFWDKGEEEVLYEGTYYACRNMQVACQGMTDKDEIRQNIKTMTEHSLDDTQETVVISDPGTTESARILREVVDSFEDRRSLDVDEETTVFGKDEHLGISDNPQDDSKQNGV